MPEDVSLNLRTAAISMAKLTPLEAFSEDNYRFHWLLPPLFAHRLRIHVIHSNFCKQGKLFAIDLSLFELPVLYKVQPFMAYLLRRNVYSDFNTVFLPLLLLAAGVGFLAACL